MNAADAPAPVAVVDCASGETVVRAPTKAELEQRQADAAEAAAGAAPVTPEPAPQLADAIAALETLDQGKPATIGDIVSALKLATPKK